MHFKTLLVSQNFMNLAVCLIPAIISHVTPLPSVMRLNSLLAVGYRVNKNAKIKRIRYTGGGFVLAIERA